MTDTEVLKSVGISEDEYYRALSISPHSDFDICLKRPVDSCFINNYFAAGLKICHKCRLPTSVQSLQMCIMYVCSYLTKDETECSQAIVNAAREAKPSNMNVRDGFKKIGAAFLSTRS